MAEKLGGKAGGKKAGGFDDLADDILAALDANGTASESSPSTPGEAPPGKNRRESANKAELRAELRAALGAAGASTTSSSGVRPLFADALPRSIHTLTPIERAGIRDTKEEVAEAMREVITNPAFVAAAMEHAREIADELPRKPAREAERISEEMAELAKKLSATKAYSDQEKERFVAECTDAIASGEGLDSLKENPVAEFFIRRGKFTKVALKAQVTEGAHDEITKPNTKAHAARAALIFAFAATGLGLEVGTTKTALVQLFDIFDPPVVKELTQALASQLQGYGYDAASAISTARLSIAATLAGGVGTTLLATKGLKKLTPKGKVAMYGTLGVSLGLGYLALQNFVADNAAVADMGSAIVEEFKPVAEKGRDAKATREEAIKGARELVLQFVANEENRPGSAGYGPFTAFLARGLSGEYNAGKLSVSEKSAAKHAALQSLVNTLAKDHFGEDNGPHKGLLQILDNVADVDVTTAPKEADVLEKIGGAAAKTTLWTGLQKVLNPFGAITTPTGMYEQARSVTKNFNEMLLKDSEVMNFVSESVDDWLVAMIAAARSQGASPNLIVDLEKLRTGLAAKLVPINAESASIEAAFNKLQKPSGKWVIVPGDKEFAQMQKTIEGSLLTTLLGFDLNAKDDFSRSFYRAGFASLLILFFLVINYGSKIGSNGLYRRREGDFESDLKEGNEQLNEKEGALASGVARFVHVANKDFVVASDSPELATVLPESVIALHVRRTLREMFLKEHAQGPSVATRFGWFIHGVFFTKTPEDVKVFNGYNEWLEGKITSLAGKGAEEALKSLVETMFPSFGSVVGARKRSWLTRFSREDSEEARRELKAQLRKLRREQLAAFATTIEDRLRVIDATDDDDTPGKQEAGAIEGLASLRLDIDGTRTIVEPHLVMRALAHSRHRDERKELVQTLEHLRSLGIRAKESEGGSENIGRFDISPLSAVKDQLLRQRAAARAGVPEASGSDEDFGRFDAYMADVASALREARDASLKSAPHIGNYSPIFEWVEGANGRFTVRISLYSDAQRITAPVGAVTFRGMIPDFGKPDPISASQKLREWLTPDGHAVRGLIAQERNATLRKELAEVFVALRKRLGTRAPSTVLVGSQKDAPLSTEEATMYQRAYDIGEILTEQEPMLSIAREGEPIPEDKYQAFLNPSAYSSNARSYVQLSERFKDIIGRNWPKGTEITYDPNARGFKVTRTSGNFLRGREVTEKRLPAWYTEDDVRKVLAAIEAESES